MSWIDKILPSGVSRTAGAKRATVPEGVWTKCIKCESVLYRPDLERNANVCPKCEHHMRVGARTRLAMFLDEENREEVFSEIEPVDRLRFRDKKKYAVRLAAAQKSTGERDALVAMRGTLHGMPIVAVAFEFSFHGGSMGQAVGEKFARAAQLSLAEKIPLVCFAASGGARMQEALISLMQMAKTSAVIERMHSESVPYVSVLTDPIYGGVSASLALLGDLNIAEPDARAGFAGPNIIEQTIRQKLPKGFQRSEFLLEHGAIDMIVSRLELRDTIARNLSKLCRAPQLALESVGDDVVDSDAVDNGDELLTSAPVPDSPIPDDATEESESEVELEADAADSVGAETEVEAEAVVETESESESEEGALDPEDSAVAEEGIPTEQDDGEPDTASAHDAEEPGDGEPASDDNEAESDSESRQPAKKSDG